MDQSIEETKSAPVFECNAGITDKMLKKTYMFLYRYSLILYGICFIFGVISMVIVLSIGKKDLLIYGAVIACMGLLSYILFTKVTMRTLIKRFREMNGSGYVLQFYETYINAVCKNGNVIYEHKNFLKTIEKADIWLICIGEKRMSFVLIVPKNAVAEPELSVYFMKSIIAPIPKKKLLKAK